MGGGRQPQSLSSPDQDYQTPVCKACQAWYTTRIMGGLGSHPLHPYAIQSFAFLLSLLVPGGVFALLLGAWIERYRRRNGRRAAEAVAAWRGADALVHDH